MNLFPLSRCASPEERDETRGEEDRLNITDTAQFSQTLATFFASESEFER
jgi:hypothetical protein